LPDHRRRHRLTAMPATLTFPLALDADAAARRALNASSAAWLVAVASALCFLPPLLQSTLQSLVRTVLLGAVLAVALLLHWVWLGLTAARLRRSVAGWLAMGVLLFPIGGATALILLNWLADEPRSPATPHPTPPPAPSVG
jgi:hypothetical protein